MNDERSASRTMTMAAPAEWVFALLDDPAVLGTHMEKPSIMMLGASWTSLRRQSTLMWKLKNLFDERFR